MIEPQPGQGPGAASASVRRPWSAGRMVACYAGRLSTVGGPVLGAVIAAIAWPQSRPQAVVAVGLGSLVLGQLRLLPPLWRRAPAGEAEGDLLSFECQRTRGYLSFRRVEGVMLVDGDPQAATAEAMRATVAEFLSWTHRQGRPVALVGVGPDHLALYQRMGFQATSQGRAAVVDLLAALPEASLPCGVSLEAIPAGLATEEVAEQVLALAAGSAQARRGALDARVLREGPVVVARDGAGRVLGVSIWRVGGPQGQAVELRTLVRLDTAPAGVVRGLLVGGLRSLRRAGYRVAVLGLQGGRAAHDDGLTLHGAPHGMQDLPLTVLAAAAGAHWEERYLLYTQTTFLPQVLYAVQRAACPSGPLLMPAGPVAPASCPLMPEQDAPHDKPPVYRPSSRR